MTHESPSTTRPVVAATPIRQETTMDSNDDRRWRNYLSMGNHFARMFGLDVRGLRQGLARSPRFLSEFLRYRQMTSQQDRSGPPRLSESFPIVSEYTDSAGVAEGDYFHADLWAARKVFAASPTHHVDVGSRVDGFVAHLLTFRHVEVVDLRPLDSQIDGLSFVRDDATALRSFPDCSIPSLSSLHAVEHFGLGRYGDQLQPDGYLRGMRSLQRVLAPGGQLYFAVPSGRARTRFNADRVIDPQEVIDTFSQLRLVELSAVLDDGQLHQHVELADIYGSRSACGLYQFIRPAV
jgi:SAM-dependent methyltransferase